MSNRKNADFRTRLLALKQRAQRLYKRRDAKGVPVERLGESWSKFAGFTLQAALIEAWRLTPSANRVHKPRGPVPGLFILGLGKLGGGDLNYSSDVDLIAFYDADTIPVPEHLGRTHVCAGVMRTLNTLLDKGLDGRFVWRVDWRLRPDPSVTDLVMSTEAAENYFFFRAAPWRRLAMLKARTVAGDTACGERFLSDVRPFIWRRHLDFQTLKDVGELKTKIRREHPDLRSEREQKTPRDQADGFHLKLGRGGIREIEFFVNAQQLLMGGRLPELQTANTLTALAALETAGLVKPETAAVLAGAYRLYRGLENRVQYHSDRHEHCLPVDAEKQRWLAGVSSAPDWHSLAAEVVTARRKVAGIFADLLEKDADTAPEQETAPSSGVLESGASGSGASGSGDQNPEIPESLNTSARQILTSWLDQPFQAYGVHPDQSARLGGVGRCLARICLASDEPEKSTDLVHRFLMDLGQPVQYLGLFADQPRVVDLVIRPLIDVPAMATLLQQSAHVTDGIIAQDLQIQDAPDFDVGRDMVAAAPTYESKLEACRAWINEQLYAVYLSVYRQRRSALQGEMYLSDLAEGALQLVAAMVLAETRASAKTGVSDGPDRQGEPANTGLLPFAILGMGRLGLRAMAPGSDLDLIFVVGDDADYEAAQKSAKRFIAALDTPMREGRVYETDMRLRPSGRAGPIVITYSQFETYQLKRAKTWEHLALAAMRPVYGAPELCAKIQRVKDRVIALDRDQDQLLKDAAFMLDRLTKNRFSDGKSGAAGEVKLAVGGLMELEYFCNFLSLKMKTGLPALLGQNLPDRTRDGVANGEPPNGAADTVTEGAADEANAQGLNLSLLPELVRTLRDYNFYSRLYGPQWQDKTDTTRQRLPLHEATALVTALVDAGLRNVSHFSEDEYAGYQEIPVRVAAPSRQYV